MSFFDDAFADDPRNRNRQSADPRYGNQQQYGNQQYGNQQYREPQFRTPPPQYPGYRPPYQPPPSFVQREPAPPSPDDLTTVLPVIRDEPARRFESPTELISPVRARLADDHHEQALTRLRTRSADSSTGRRRRSTRSTLWRVAITAGAFTTLLVTCAASLAGVTYEKYNGQLTRVEVLQTHDKNIREPARQQHAANFLMIGSDSRQGANAEYGNEAGARSDTTILVHLSPDHSRATVISIPRDSWVDIPACKRSDGTLAPEHQDMFNAAFSLGGPACTIATVQKLTGIAVTHFLEIDFSGFEKMINAMGKVSICSPVKVVDDYSGLRLNPGVNRLGGHQALAYVRARESIGDGSDLGRIKRQQLFLGAVLRQAMTGKLLSNPARLTRFLDAATKSITVDKGTTFQDLRTLATSMQGLDPRRVTFYTAPIADRNYSPPGTTMTGKVLLDSVQGRILYDAVINDRKPVWVRKVNGKTTIVNGPNGSAVKKTPATKTPSPTAGPTAAGTAAQASCTL